MYGDVVLSTGYGFRSGNSVIRPDQLARDANPFLLDCTGTGLFADIAPGTVVSLLNGSGTVLASGAIVRSATTLGDANGLRCTFGFTIEKAPVGITGAQVRVGQHSPVTVKPDYDRGYSTLNLMQ